MENHQKSRLGELTLTAPKLEEVFKKSGVPTYTFVEPAEYKHLQVAMRTPGRGLVVEGPSGIGKTTAVFRVIEDIGLSSKAQKLSARIPADREMIAGLPGIAGAGVVVIDDFHRLDDPTKGAIADYMKDLADREDAGTKIVLIGINKAGEALVSFAPDLNNRIDTIRFEVNSKVAVEELIRKGTEALNIKIECADDIANDSIGSFHITQILCHELCLASGITERSTVAVNCGISIEVVKERVLEELARSFLPPAIKFARGKRFRRAGRAPYLHLLHWLSGASEWAIPIDRLLAHHKNIRGSVSQVVDKGHLSSFLEKEADLQDLLHFDPLTKILSVEDPKFIYFLRNLLWSKFVQEVGYLSIEFRSRYDFALSFAGEQRAIAEKLYESLVDGEMEVFYDKQEQHRILAEDVEEYLAPIYRSEARFVVVFLSREYPRKVWTKFESEQFKSRFGQKSVIPIWFSDAPPGVFDQTSKIGGMLLDVAGDIDAQIEEISEVLVAKVAEERSAEDKASTVREQSEDSEEE